MSSAGTPPLFRIGWFSTARGPTSRLLLQAAWEAMASGRIPATLEYVFCSRDYGESAETDRFLDQVQSYGVPLIVRSFDRYRAEHAGRSMGFDGSGFAPWRVAYDEEVRQAIADQPVDLVLLLGYMLVMSPPLCDALTAINLHPAAPGGPVGTWQQVIWQLIEQRAARSGVYIHLVTRDLDLGPVLTYCTYDISGPAFASEWAALADRPISELRAQLGEDLPLFKKIREAGVARELPSILETLRAFAERRVQIDGARLIDPEGRPLPPLDLTSEVEAAVAAAKAVA